MTNKRTSNGTATATATATARTTATATARTSNATIVATAATLHDEGSGEDKGRRRVGQMVMTNRATEIDKLGAWLCVLFC